MRRRKWGGNTNRKGEEDEEIGRKRRIGRV